MTLREAVLTGKPLKRTFNKEWYAPYRVSIIANSKGLPTFFAPFLAKDGHNWAIAWDDIMADDWEIQDD